MSATRGVAWLLVGAAAIGYGCRRTGTPGALARPGSAAVAPTSDGVRLLMASDFVAADAKFRDAILADSDFVTARVLRAVGHMLAGNDAAAIGELRIVRGITNRPPCADRLMARACYRRGAVDVAREAFEQCVDTQPESAEARFFVALASRTPAQMRERLDALLDENPEYWEARAVRARVRAALDDPGGAVGDVLTCLRARPDDAAMWWQLADALSAMGAEPAAEFALKRVIALDPGWSTAYERLARIYVRRGETARAIELVDKAIAADSSRRAELEAIRAGLDSGGESPSAGRPGDVALSEEWEKLLLTSSSKAGSEGRLDNLGLMLVLDELHAGGWAAGLPPAWSDEQIAAERVRIIDDARTITTEARRLLEHAAGAEKP